MAKRKKKRGGGAFGGGAKAGSNGPVIRHDFGGPRQDPLAEVIQAEESLKVIQKALMSQGIKSIEELEKFFIERVADKPLDELAAEFLSEGPKTDLDRAEYLMDGLDEDASPAEIRRAAEQALEISPYCLAAWLALANQEEDPAKALEYLDEGIEKGRVRYDGLIESLEEDQGIWGWIEARDFMRLLHQRAVVLEVLGDFKDAMETYQEMLTLNPPDDQSIRGDLLRLMIVFRQIDEASALVNRFPNDADVAMAYGRALLSFVRAMDRTGFELPDLEGPGAPQSPRALMKRLGPEFDTAKKHLKHALKINPFVPWMMTHPQLMGVEVGDRIAFGGAAEAVMYAQKWAYVWYAGVLPFIAINASMGSDPQRLVKTDFIREELLEVLDQFDELNESPWWEGFESGES